MGKARIEIVLVINFLIWGWFWFDFQSKTPTLFIISAVILMGYYLFLWTYEKHKHYRPQSQESQKLRVTIEQILPIALGLVSAVVVSNCVAKLLRLDLRLNLQMITFVVLVGTGVYIILHYLWTNQRTIRSLLMRYVCLFGIQLAIMSISDRQVVHVQYRNYPEFIQVYDFFELDPENEELRNSLIIEHKRIVLPEEEFKKFEENNRFQRRSKNHW
jgi:cytochrome c biogenesis protein CcdA